VGTRLKSTGEKIIISLQQVAQERTLRASEAGLGEAVVRVKAFQHDRFARTYADLITDARYRDVTNFFMDDIYGPGDFSQRDAQFARIVPALVRLFPSEIVQTIAQLAELHALSEQFDTAMGRRLGLQTLDGQKYGEVWRAVGEPMLREKQIDLIVAIGSALDRYTRKAMLRHSLRVMRRPAHAAGLGSLQTFLERGFDTFRAMGGANDFLALISQRERALAAILFQPGGAVVETPA
jgi:hypothetical protein